MLDAQTQGRGRADALAMIKELLELMVDRRGFEVEVHSRRGSGVLEISSNNDAALVAAGLRRLRRSAGLSLQEVADRLGQKSHNAYARYEQARAVPTITKLGELVRALNPELDLVLGKSQFPAA